MGEYVEIIDPTALDFADMTDIRLLRDHISNLLLARNTSDTLKIQKDQTGLFFRATMPDTALGNDTSTLVQRRDLSQCSWGFWLSDKDSVWTYNKTSGQPTRRVMRVEKVFDISLTTYAANPMTKAWISEARSEARDFVPDIEPYQNVLDHIENSKNMVHTENRAKSKTESSNAPFYECASNQVQNAQRAAVLAKAREIRAAHSKTEKPATGDWRADLAARQKQLAEMQERHEREYAESLKRSADTPEAFAETKRRLDYSLHLEAKYSAPVV